MPDKD